MEEEADGSVLIDEAVYRDLMGKSRAVFICPHQMGPPPGSFPPLMSSASFILISEQVPERRRLTYR